MHADKGHSTVVIDKAEFTAKLESLLKVAYKLSETGEFKKHVNSVNKAIDKLRKAEALKRQEALTAKPPMPPWRASTVYQKCVNRKYLYAPKSHYAAPRLLDCGNSFTNDSVS
nr:unnamed protein product [Spirometra erinaceieuropaei]